VRRSDHRRYYGLPVAKPQLDL